MEILRGFVEEHVARFQVSHLGVADVIFDDYGPRFGIVRACNMVDAGNHMGLRSICMHPQARFISILKHKTKKLLDTSINTDSAVGVQSNGTYLYRRKP